MPTWHQKLVRDKIPGIIQASKQKPVTRRRGVREYKEALRDKLLEEVEEFRRAKGKQAMLEELADIQEVLAALCGAEGIQEKEVTQVGAKKRRERGGFSKRIFLERVEEKE